jgi:prevent-host-death family protein
VTLGCLEKQTCTNAVPKQNRLILQTREAQWDAVIDRVCRDQRRVLIEENGMPVAAIVSVDDYRRLSQLELLREKQFEALDASWLAFKDVPDDEATVEREVASAVTAARAQRRKDKRTARAS